MPLTVIYAFKGVSNERNKILDRKATKVLALVHSNLARPLGKEGYRYVLNFIDDYSGLIMLYFFRHKFNTLLATKKYLASLTAM